MNLIGTTISKYEIVEEIGWGGMATVYKAYQPSLDRYVAVKVLTPDLSRSENFIVRFEREAKTIAKLRHRNILTIFDYGRQDNLIFLTMEYVDGGTLKDQFGWPQPLDYAVDITTQIGSALVHAHRQGIIHRDVKPANVLVADDNWLLLSDFGLVKMAEDSLQLTMSGTSLGTPQYMSPEQAQAMELDYRSDIYSLGVVLYEAITGQPPFGTDNPVAIIMKHINEPIIPPHTLRSDLPMSMERVMLKALAKSPTDRYQRTEDFLDDLHEAYKSIAHFDIPPLNNIADQTREPSSQYVVTPVSSSAVTKSRRKKSSAWLGLTILLVLILIIGLTYFIFKDTITTLAAALTDVVTVPSSVGQVVSSPTARLSATPEPKPTTSQTNSATTEFTASTVPSSLSPTVALISTLTPAAATPEPIKITTRIWEGDGAEMVFVPAGEFMMGSEELGDDERPARSVYLDDFWIDRYEVTNAQFNRFVKGTNHQTEAERQGWGWVRTSPQWDKVAGADWRHPRGPDSSIETKMEHPVVLVSWNDAAAYCRWATKRLPTEAEWEKAARGPVTISDVAQRFAWGDEFDPTKANTQEANYNDTRPVGSFSPEGNSPYGAADMTGNVWEWVADWYDNSYYQSAPSVNPPGPQTGTDKILRGGSWLFDQLYARTAFRYNIRPDYTYDFAGFRCSSSQ